MRPKSIPVLLLCIGLLSHPLLHAQNIPLDTLLSRYSYPLLLKDGRLEGEGVQVILNAAAAAQFFAIAEEHNLRELNHLSQMLFDTLRKAHDFRFLALEQGGVITRWLNKAAVSGGQDSVLAFVRRYPHAATFATDEEFRLIGRVAETSKGAYDAVWGVDQEYGATHILDRLAGLARTPAARSKARELAERAWMYEKDRTGDSLFLAGPSAPSDFAPLRQAFDPQPGSEAGFLIDALERTSRIYDNQFISRLGQFTLFESVAERELSMKRRFMEEYRRAQSVGIKLPRVILKLGHWHIIRGVYQGNVNTLGDFVDQLSIANGMNTFILSTYVSSSTEQWRVNPDFAGRAIPGADFTIIDFRPLRARAHQNAIDGLTDVWKIRLFRYDAALVVRYGRTGSYDTVGKK